MGDVIFDFGKRLGQVGVDLVAKAVRKGTADPIDGDRDRPGGGQLVGKDIVDGAVVVGQKVRHADKLPIAYGERIDEGQLMRHPASVPPSTTA